MHSFTPKRSSKCSRHTDRFPSSCWRSQHIASIDSTTARRHFNQTLPTPL
ncbi:hypothetical protein HMPREF9594_01688 [Cutibacterium acnes HL005PA1]|nr:hypothetical protein HMPREF9594_01688 [Cutibacterium acnes HL005PA1]